MNQHLSCFYREKALIRRKIETSQSTHAEIGVPSDCRIIAPIIVGYPASIPAASERHSPDILKVVK